MKMNVIESCTSTNDCDDEINNYFCKEKNKVSFRQLLMNDVNILMGNVNAKIRMDSTAYDRNPCK